MMSAFDADEVRSVPQICFSREPPGDVFTVLGISAHPKDLDRLRNILSRINWKLREARSCHEATTVLSCYWMPIIICDRSLPDGNWKDILSLTAPLLEPPRVIVMSDAVDDSWSAEVLDMRGYGVLAKPLDEGEVTRILGAVCPNWRSGWAGTGIELNAA
jgi:DNA-binding response OmpR family regulator